MKSKNCIPILTRFDVTVERGTISRGKYTFPKMFWFAVNVVEVLVRQSAKYASRLFRQGKTAAEADHRWIFLLYHQIQPYT